MLTDAPTVRTNLDAIDELDDVHHALAGLAQLVLAAADSGMAEKDALLLTARLLDYFSLVVASANARLDAKD